MKCTHASVAVVLIVLVWSCSSHPLKDQQEALKDANYKKPAHYLLTNPNQSLVFSYERNIDGVLAMKSTMIATYEGEIEYKGEPVNKYKAKWDHRPYRGDAFEVIVIIYEKLTESESTTVYEELGNHIFEKEEVPFINLRAPIKTGTKWSFEVQSYITNRGQKGPVNLRYQMEIIDDKAIVHTPAGIFRDGLKIHEVGVSTTPFTAQNENGVSFLASARIDTIYEWVPKMGVIKSTNTSLYTPEDKKFPVMRFSNLEQLIEIKG
jgi:hypothetical protein